MEQGKEPKKRKTGQLQIDPKSRDRFQKWLDHTDHTQTGTTGRITDWFILQPPLLQSAILKRLPAGVESSCAKSLRDLAKEVETGKCTLPIFTVAMEAVSPGPADSKPSFEEQQQGPKDIPKDKGHTK